MATRKRSSKGDGNLFYFVVWSVPSKAHKRYSTVMALPVNGTPVDHFGYIEARAAKCCGVEAVDMLVVESVALWPSS